MSLRKRLIRLAATRPDLRAKLLPILAYNPAEDEEDPNKALQGQVAEIIQVLRQAAKRPPRLRMMMLADAAGRLLDAIEQDMKTGTPANMGFGMRQLRQLRNRLRDTLGDAAKP